jgi:CHAT domain-containing protein
MRNSLLFCFSVSLFLSSFNCYAQKLSDQFDGLVMRGDACYSNKNYDSALFIYKQFLTEQNVEYKADSITRSEVLYKIGKMYRFYYYEPQNALTYLDGAILLQKLLLPANDIHYGKTLYELASVNRSLAKYEYASSCAKQALSIAEYNKDINFMTNCLVMTANILNAQNLLNEANNYYFEAIKVLKGHSPKNPTLSNYYNNLSISYKRLKMYDSAKYYIQKSIVLNKINNNLSALSNDYFILAILLVSLEEYDQALLFYQKCLGLRKEIYGHQHPEVALVYNAMARLYESIEKYELAMDYIQKAIISLIPEFKSTLLEDLPDIKNVENRYEAFLILTNRSRILNQMLALSADSKNIDMAIQTAIKADSLLEINRSSFLRNGSKMFIQDHFNEFYEYYLNALFLKYEVDNDPQTLSEIFRVMESNKSLILLDELKTLQMSTHVYITDSLILEEKRLQKALTINDFQFSKRDKEQRKLLEDEAYALSQEYILLRNKLAQSYPGYYNLKYKKMVDLQTIKSTITDDNKGLLISFDGNKHIFLLLITKNDISLSRIEKDEIYNRQLNTILNCTYSPNYMSNVVESYKQFTSSSHYIFNKLFGSMDLSHINQLIVIPDGKLSYLPFEVLTTMKVEGKMPNFKKLPYLINDLEISYSYSVSLISDGQVSIVNKPKMLAIGYASNADLNGNLVGTRNELESIESNWPFANKVLYDGSENDFKSLINDYEIIHIGLHGSADSTAIEQTKLFFSKAGKIDDGVLDSHELYSLNTRANMVFLSACETGFGKQARGEGVFSLSRGFIYAGSKSVVQTLWRINDQISASIVEDFYKNLTKNITSKNALRNAKLKFVNESDEITAHPYNWASFQYVGEDYKIPKQTYTYSMIIGILLFVSIVFLFKRTRLQRS